MLNEKAVNVAFLKSHWMYLLLACKQNKVDDTHTQDMQIHLAPIGYFPHRIVLLYSWYILVRSYTGEAVQWSVKLAKAGQFAECISISYRVYHQESNFKLSYNT